MNLIKSVPFDMDGVLKCRGGGCPVAGRGIADGNANPGFRRQGGLFRYARSAHPYVLTHTPDDPGFGTLVKITG